MSVIAIGRVLSMRTIHELRLLTVDNFVGRGMTKEEFIHVGGICQAVWQHSGDPTDPHVVMTAGNHSNGFIDTLRVLQYTNLCQIIAYTLIQKYKGPVPDWVVGSDHAGAALSHSIAILLNAKHDFTEKGPDGTQLWKRFQIGEDELVWHVEELVTSTKTTKAVRRGIQDFHPYPIQFVEETGVAVDRRKDKSDGGFLAAFGFNIDAWEPPVCPLCAGGSRAIEQPKKHWAELTRRHAAIPTDGYATKPIKGA